MEFQHYYERIAKPFKWKFRRRDLEELFKKMQTGPSRKHDASDFRNRVLTMPPTPRVERLLRRYFDTKKRALTDVGRIVTRVWKETEGQPPMARRAQAFAATVREVPTKIYPDELFVGWMWSVPRGTEVNMRTVGLEGEFDTLATRPHTPFLIDEEDQRLKLAISIGGVIHDLSSFRIVSIVVKAA